MTAGKKNVCSTLLVRLDRSVSAMLLCLSETVIFRQEERNWACMLAPVKDPASEALNRKMRFVQCDALLT